MCHRPAGLQAATRPSLHHRSTVLEDTRAMRAATCTLIVSSSGSSMMPNTYHLTKINAARNRNDKK
jgi:hypothetical protein